MASEIQNSLLPRELPKETGLEISAINTMARRVRKAHRRQRLTVGGDYYDCVVNP